MENQLFAQRIQARMDELNTNALTVSVEAGLGKTAVRDIIKGKSKKPTMHTMNRIAKVLGCSIAYLMGDVDDPKLMTVSTKALDMQMMTVFDSIEAGAFKRDNRTASRIEVPVVEHPNYLGFTLHVFLVADNSMAGEGIIRGDVVTIAKPSDDSAVELSNGVLVVCATTIVPPHVTEISARRVHVTEEGIELRTNPLNGKPDIVRLSEDRPASFPANLYMSVEGNGVTIDGKIVRLMRDFG